MKKISALLVLLTLVAAPLLANGAEFRGGEEYKIRHGEVIEGNAYSAGGNVSLEGDVNGDLFVVGGNIIITGNIKDDLFVLGGTVNVLGSVGGDARVVGGNVTIGGEIGGELAAAGGTVTMLSSATVGGDVDIAGGEISLDGVIGKGLRVYAGILGLSGEVQEEVSANVDEKMTIASSVKIGGDLIYKAPKEAEITEGALISGKTEYSLKESQSNVKQARSSKKGLAAIFTIWFFMKLFMIILAGFGLLWLMKSHLENGVKRSLESFGVETLRGFIVLIIVPVGAVVLCVTVLGLMPGLLAFFAYGMLIILAKATAGIIFGSVVERAFNKSKYVPVNWKTIVGGSFGLALLTLIPFIGWIVVFVFFLAALGAWTAGIIGTFKKA